VEFNNAADIHIGHAVAVREAEEFFVFDVIFHAWA
jgi:hypothetical protein